MEQPVVLVKKEKGIATVTYNRPENLNALNRELLDRLVVVVGELKDDDTVKVVVTTGAGQAYCAGADLVYPFLGLTNTAEIREYMNKVNTIVFNLRTMAKPVISAVNGAAVGGGFSYALAGDIIIASEKARFSPGFTAIGLHPDNGATYLLPRLVGMVRASELFFTNRMVGAAEALQMGMVNRVVAPELLEPTVYELAATLTRAAPTAIALTKDSLNRSLGMDLAAMMELESKAQSICYLTEDCKEGVTAFLEKRKPVYKGR